MRNAYLKTMKTIYIFFFHHSSRREWGRGGRWRWRWRGGGRWRWWRRGRWWGRGRGEKSEEDGRAKISGQSKWLLTRFSYHLLPPFCFYNQFIDSFLFHFSCQWKWRLEKWKWKTRHAWRRRRKQRRSAWPSWWWRKRRSTSTTRSCSERREKSERFVQFLCFLHMDLRVDKTIWEVTRANSILTFLTLYPLSICGILSWAENV